MRKPAVVQIIAHHSKHERRRFPLPVKIAYRLLAPTTARALAVSNSVRDFAASDMGFRDEVLEVLHPPIPRHSFSMPSAERVASLRAHYGIDERDPVIGAVTRFYPTKGITFLVSAFARVKAVHPTARLVLLGVGPEEEALRAQVRDTGYEDSVIFAGYQRDISVYERLFSVAAVPSLEEGFGLSAVEAMALGAQLEAMITDPVYEGKSLAGLIDLVKDADIPRDSTVLYAHLGGQPAINAYHSLWSS